MNLFLVPAGALPPLPLHLFNPHSCPLPFFLLLSSSHLFLNSSVLSHVTTLLSFLLLFSSPPSRTHPPLFAAALVSLPASAGFAVFEAGGAETSRSVRVTLTGSAAGFH